MNKTFWEWYEEYLETICKKSKNPDCKIQDTWLSAQIIRRQAFEMGEFKKMNFEAWEWQKTNQKKLDRLLRKVLKRNSCYYDDRTGYIWPKD